MSRHLPARKAGLCKASAMDDCLAMMLGSTFAIFVTAGNFKAAFDLPDLTIVFGAASVLVAMLLVMRCGRIPRPPALALRWWFFISLLCLLSTVLNPLWDGWREKLLRLIVVDGWCLLGGTYLACRTKALEAFFLSFLLVGVLASLAAVRSSPGLGTSAVWVQFANYLDVARLAGMTSLLCLARLARARAALSRGAYAVGAGLTGVLALGAGGRGPALALLIALALWGVMAIKLSSGFRHKSRVIGLFLLLVLLLWGAGERGLYSATLSRLNNELVDTSRGSIGGHLRRLQSGMTLWLESPLLGSGANAFPTYYGSRNIESSVHEGYLDNYPRNGDSYLEDTPHNLIIELAAEFGLIPALAALFCAAHLLYRCVALWNRTPPCLAAPALVFCVLGLTFWVVQYPLMGISSAKYLMAFLGFAVALSTPNHSRSSTTPKRSPITL